MSPKVVHLMPPVLRESIRFIEQLPDERARKLALVVVDGLVRLLRVGAVEEQAALVGLLPIVMRFVGEDWMEEVVEMMTTIPSAALRREARRRLGDPVPPAQMVLLVRLAGVDDPAARAR